MKQTLIILLLSLNFFSCANNTDNSSAPTTTDNTKPIKEVPLTTVQWLDSSLQFTKIKEGTLVDISFRFLNTGTNPLVFSNVVASCGCTIAEKPELPIQPGKQGAIKATFNSSGRVGMNHKTLTAYLNTIDGNHPLTFDVDVIASKK
jgi:hypothetical protein